MPSQAYSNSDQKIESISKSEVFEVLQTGDSGLNTEEALLRLKQLGPNTIQEKKGKPLIFKLLANFTHLMAILLWIGGVVALIAKLPQLAIAIWLVNIINGLFQFLAGVPGRKSGRKHSINYCQTMPG